MSLAYRKHLQLRHSEGHSDGVTAVSFSSTGDFLASGGLDGRVCVWDMHAGELRYVFSGNSAVLCLEWLPPTLSIVCGMEDGTLALLSIVHDVMMVNRFWAHQYPVERLAYSGDQLASGAHKEVKVWTYLPKAKEFKQDSLLQNPPSGSYNSDADVLATGLHWVSTGRRSQVLAVTYMSHGIALFSSHTWQRIRTIAVPGHIAYSSITNDGRFLAVSNMRTGFDVYELRSLSELEPVRSFKQERSEERPLPVVFVQSGRALVGGTSRGRLHVWSLESQHKQGLDFDDEMCILAVAAPPTELLIATAPFRSSPLSPIVIWKVPKTDTPDGIMILMRNVVGKYMHVVHAMLSITLWGLSLAFLLFSFFYFMDVYSEL